MLTPKNEMLDESGDIMDDWSNQVLDRVDMLKQRFGVVRPGSEELTAGSFFHHWKTDDKKVNQGHCYFNDFTNTYYVRPREHHPTKNKSYLDAIYFEIERENNQSGHDTINFYITGEYNDQTQ